MTHLSPPGRLGVRAALDVVATLALIAASGFLIWSTVRPPSPAAPPAARDAISIPVAPVSLEGAATLGSATARVVMIEFSDFQCPFCGKFAREVLPQIKKRYVDTGQVRLAFRHLPLDIHAEAVKAAEIAVCADQQQRFWPLHDRLFAPGLSLTPSTFTAATRDAGLDAEALAACLSGEVSQKRVAGDLGIARSLRLTSTPSFLIGALEASGLVRVVRAVAGARPQVDFETALDDVLRRSAAVTK